MENKNLKDCEINTYTRNKKVNSHIKSKFYDVEGFKKGKTSLNKFELEELSEVEGKS